jgi:hypothetical protein
VQGSQAYKNKKTPFLILSFLFAKQNDGEHYTFHHNSEKEASTMSRFKKKFWSSTRMKTKVKKQKKIQRIQNTDQLDIIIIFYNCLQIRQSNTQKKEIKIYIRIKLTMNSNFGIRTTNRPSKPKLQIPSGAVGDDSSVDVVVGQQLLSDHQKFTTAYQVEKKLNVSTFPSSEKKIPDPKEMMQKKNNVNQNNMNSINLTNGNIGSCFRPRSNDTTVDDNIPPLTSMIGNRRRHRRSNNIDFQCVLPQLGSYDFADMV